MTQVSVRQHEPQYVPGHLVDLDVHAPADPELPERRAALGMRDDVRAEARARCFIDGETHAIDCDRALRRQVARERRGYLDDESPRACIAAHLGDVANTVDVT